MWKEERVKQMRWKIRCKGGRATGIQSKQRIQFGMILMTAFTLLTPMFTLKTSDCHLQAHNKIWLSALKPLWFQVETEQSCGARDYLGGLLHYRNRAELWRERLPWWFIALQKESQRGNGFTWNDACSTWNDACSTSNDACSTSKSRRKLTWNCLRE